jgi:dolichol-phosphate mannosyltransferase
VADALIIIPTYNEIEGLQSIVERVRTAVTDADILIVDDASPDGTGELADQLATADTAITVLHRIEKDGLGRAYIAGFSVAIERGYAYICQLDSDGSHDPAELPAMLELARGGADLVIGSRWVPGGSVVNWPWQRQAISRTGNWYARTVLRSGIRDITAGFRVFRTTALQALQLDGVSSHGYGFQVETAWKLERMGTTIVEHPITFVERESGESKMHTGIVVEALMRVTGWGIGSLAASGRSAGSKKRR